LVFGKVVYLFGREVAGTRMFVHPKDVEALDESRVELKRLRRDSLADKQKELPNFVKLHVEGIRLLNTLNLIGNFLIHKILTFERKSMVSIGNNTF
jgi:hypothetical protein